MPKVKRAPKPSAAMKRKKKKSTVREYGAKKTAHKIKKEQMPKNTGARSKRAKYVLG